MGPLMASPLIPMRSIAAWSMSAAFEMRAMVHDLIRQFCLDHARVNLCLHVDDATMEVVGEIVEYAVGILAQAAVTLAHGFAILGLPLAEDRARVLSSHSRAAHMTVEMLGQLAGEVVKATAHLGIDFAPVGSNAPGRGQQQPGRGR